MAFVCEKQSKSPKIIELSIEDISKLTLCDGMFQYLDWSSSYEHSDTGIVYVQPNQLKGTNKFILDTDYMLKDNSLDFLY